jgi:polysaccharide transporter, PST family
MIREKILKSRLMNYFTNLSKREYFSLVLSNIGWQSLDKIIRMGMGIIVSVWITRYLGPDLFGKLSYALAFAGIFSCIASLGLDGIAIRDLSKSGSDKDTILGTAFFLRLCGASLAIILSTILIVYIKSSDLITIWLVVIIAFGMVFSSFDIIDLWFQSQIQYKFTFYAKNAAFIISSIVKIALILIHAPLLYFAIVTTFEIILGAVGLLLVYKLTDQKIFNWRIHFEKAAQLLSESWPLIIAGFATFIYVKIDQIMLGTMLTNKEVGVYSAAIKFSEIWYFIPGVIYASVLPALTNNKKLNESLFYIKYQKICSLMAAIPIGIAIIMTFASGLLIHIVYGTKYFESGPILAVHIWAGVFVFIGVAGSIWTMIEGFQKFQLFAAILGGISNILLNLVLIPHYAGFGAAIATVISYAIGSYFAFFLLPGTRKIGLILTKSLFTPWYAFIK